MNLFRLNKNKHKEKHDKEMSSLVQEKAISRANQIAIANGIVSDLLASLGNWSQLKSAEQQLRAWNDISDLRTVISKISNYFVRVNLVHEKKTKDGWIDISETSDLIKLLNKPNDYQDRNDFLEQAYSYYNVTGNCFIHSKTKLAGFNKIPSKITLHNLSTAKVEAYTNDKEFFSNKIKEFKYKNADSSLGTIYPDEMIHIKEIDILNDGNYSVVGNSKLTSQKHQLTNLKVGYEAKNVILAKRGALGMFTNKGGEHYYPITEPEKKRIQEDYNSKYGLTNEQWQVIFTNASLVWNQIGMNTKDLQIFESLEDDRQSLCSCYSLPYLLFKNGGADSSTFANLDTATKQVYREKIIPDWGTFQSAFNNYFELEAKGERLLFDYSNIDVLQDDKGKLIANNSAKTTAISDLLNKYNTSDLTYEQAFSQLTDIWSYSEESVTTLLSNEQTVITNNNNITDDN